MVAEPVVQEVSIRTGIQATGIHAIRAVHELPPRVSGH